MSRRALSPCPRCGSEIAASDVCAILSGPEPAVICTRCATVPAGESGRPTVVLWAPCTPGVTSAMLLARLVASGALQEARALAQRMIAQEDARVEALYRADMAEMDAMRRRLDGIEEIMEVTRP